MTRRLEAPSGLDLLRCWPVGGAVQLGVAPCGLGDDPRHDDENKQHERRDRHAVGNGDAEFGGMGVAPLPMPCDEHAGKISVPEMRHERFVILEFVGKGLCHRRQSDDKREQHKGGFSPRMALFFTLVSDGCEFFCHRLSYSVLMEPPSYEIIRTPDASPSFRRRPARRNK